jgi:sugar phosphate permease
MDRLQAATVAKVTKRLVPFLMVCYFVAYLDRVNVSFAALTMNADLGLSQTAFGFGAGIFSLPISFSRCPRTCFSSASAPANGSHASC